MDPGAVLGGAQMRFEAGELIYEPFSGSGTAIIAAASTGRVCYALEQSPAFVDVAVARWEAFVGRKARLEKAKEGGPNG